MACEGMYQRRGRTIAQATEEVRVRTNALSKMIESGKVIVKVGPQGAVTFQGWADQERDGITDACALRRIMSAGSAQAKLKVAMAEQLAGRRVDQKQVNAGTHSHDGGTTWHNGH